MKFKVDENLPIEVSYLLQEAGYNSTTIYSQNLVGEADHNIAVICKAEKRAIVTLDTDFGDIRTYPPKKYFGIIVLRLKQQDKPHVLQIIKRIIPTLKKEKLIGYLWIVDEKRIRIRD